METRRERHRPMWERVERRINEHVGIETAPREIPPVRGISQYAYRDMVITSSSLGSQTFDVPSSVYTWSGVDWARQLEDVILPPSQPSTSSERSRYPTNRK